MDLGRWAPALVPLLIGCGGAGATTRPTREARDAGDDEVVARLGCDVLRERDVDRALREVRAHLPEEARAQVTREDIANRLVLDHIASRAVHELGLTVSDAEVARAMQSVQQQNGVDEAELAAELERRGMSIEGYREAIRAQILRLRLAVMLSGGVELEPDAVTQNLEQWLARARRRLGEVPTTSTGGRCREQPELIAPASLRFEGNQAVEAETLRTAAQSVGSTRGLPVGLDGSLDPRVVMAIVGAYFDAGYLRASVALTPESPERIRVTEGEQFHFGRADAVRLAERGGERAPAPEAAALAAEAGVRTGERFSRAVVVRWARAATEQARAAGTTVHADPETHIEGTSVDVTLVLTPTD